MKWHEKALKRCPISCIGDDEALRRSTRHGYITVSTFMFYSGLKRNSAKNFLDSLCEGDRPRLRRYREGRTLHYAIVADYPTE